MGSKWLPRAASHDDRPPLPEKPKDGWQFPNGAYIKDAAGVEYYATPAQAEAYQTRVDDKSLSDADFWTWFDQFRKDYYLYPVTKWSGAKKSSGMSGWWQYDLHSAFGSSLSDSDRKLTLALRAVSTTVRIVDDSTPPYTVEWAAEDVSSTDVEGRRIVINPKPIVKPGKLTSAQAIDITTAFGLHEAGHARYTSKVSQPLLDDKPLPWSVAMFLANVLEDVRTEALTSKEYPGFAGYFPMAAEYMWNDMLSSDDPIKKVTWPEQWGTSIKDCLNAIVMTIKWPDKATTILTDQSFLDEMPWWVEWNDRYQSGATSLREAVVEGLERLRTSTNEDTKAEMDKATQADQRRKDAGAQMKESDIPGTIKPCINSHDRADELDSGTADAVRRNVQEKLSKWLPKTDHGDTPPTIWVSHPLETNYSKASYVGKPSGIINRLKDVLTFRPELPRWSDRLLKHGELDEEELYRFAFQDFRMFEKQVVEAYPNAHVSLLVDMSGSMTGSAHGGYRRGGGKSKVEVAQELAQLFTSALSSMPGVHPMVFGHTGDLRDSDETEGSAEFYRLWEPGEPMTRLGLISAMDHGDNFDGYAIEWCVEELLDRGAPDDQRLLVVLSDGEPAGNGYGDWEGIQHVRAVTDAADKQQVFVVQVAIDPYMREAHQAKMFKHFVQFTSEDELPKQLAKALGSFLNG